MEQKVILKHYKEYLDQELAAAKRIFNHPTRIFYDAGEIYSQTIQRVLGASTFVQNLGVDYFVIDSCYEEFKIKLSKLFDKRKQV